MANFASSESVILKGLRAAWLDIFEPGEGMNGGAPKFKFVGLMTPDQTQVDKVNNQEVTRKTLDVAKAAMLEAATKLWGENAANMVRSMAANSRAVRDGNDKMADDGTVRPEYKDMFYVSASSKASVKPLVIAPKLIANVPVVLTKDGRGFHNGRDVTDEVGYALKAPYRGCYVNAKLVFTAGKSFKGADGQIIPNQVFARIEAIQFVRDGEAFGAGPANAEGFSDEEVDTSAAGGNDLF
ncbi:hypothetical protein [Acidovorax phage ACPWH]|nr:hypothetical protein [Acidovorax phage ACPWH]QXV72226.1 hypothetical protein Acf1_00029 [Acidovorax phage ACF1]